MNLIILILSFFSFSLYAKDLSHVYLYWNHESLSTTMAIGVHTPINTKTIYAYVSKDKNKQLNDSTRYSAFQSNCYPELNRCVHTFSLKDLLPHSIYYLILSDGKTNIGSERKFRTLAENSDNITMVSGGDLSTTPESKLLLVKAASYSPDLAVLGGDLAYDNGEIKNIGLWDTWLSNWEESMVTPDGFTIPMILVIGNHEVKGGWGATVSDATLFLKFFQQQGNQTYFVRKLGKLALLMVLDTGHIATVEEQAPWILKTLAEYSNTPYRFAAYHVPLYPSHRRFENDQSAKLRQYWGPAFDQGLNFALEHHDHSLKRTHLIKANKRDDKNGILYLGDGCMGVERRDVHSDSWYLAKAMSVGHFWLTKFSKQKTQMEALDISGKVLDSAEIKNLKAM